MTYDATSYLSCNCIVPNLTHEQAEQELKQLAREIAYHDNLYYNQAQPEISDTQYDQLRRRNAALEAQFPDLIQPDSPSHRVGAKIQSKFNKVPHKTPMLSLDNVFNEVELKDFIEKINRFLDQPLSKEFDFFAEPKIDGLSASLIYHKGILVQASTRGDGSIGEDVIQNVKTIQNVPLYLPCQDIDNLEVRGEVYMPKTYFEKLNKERKEMDEVLFSSPRNAAAGSLRQLDPSITRKRHLCFFAYEWLCAEQPLDTQEAVLNHLKALGFSTAPDVQLCHSLNDLLNFYRQIESKREALPYDIDGVVYKLNDRSLQQRLGTIGRVPRHSIAHKFPPQQVETVLRDIIIQVGRMGTMTPVAVFDDVQIGGVTINRATLHNADEIQSKDIHINDTIILQRAGDVIPQIVEVQFKKRPEQTVPFEFPKQCPSCNTTLVRDENRVAIRCPAGFACEAQAIERLKHFVSRDAFNIEGLGDKAISFLYKTKRIQNFADIFTLEQRNKAIQESDLLTTNFSDCFIQSTPLEVPLERCAGWNVRSVKNLFHAINQRRQISLDRFIYSLGIPQVGKQTATLIAQEYETFDAFRQALPLQLSLFDGIGEKTAKEIHSFFQNKELNRVIDQLCQYIEMIPLPKKEGLPYSGKTIVFTGKLIHMTRQEAKAIAERLGAKVASTVTQKTDLVVIGQDAGQKKAIAEKLNIPTMDETEWQLILHQEKHDQHIDMA